MNGGHLEGERWPSLGGENESWFANYLLTGMILQEGHLFFGGWGIYLKDFF